MNDAWLDEKLSEPTVEVVEAMKRIRGDLVILGVAGKIGVTLGMMAKRAMLAAGSGGRVIGVSRFSDAKARDKLEKAGVETVSCDLLDRKALEKLPDADHVVFMAGRKFGTSGNEELTWAMNTIVPANVGWRYPGSRTVVYSTGCVYDFVPLSSGGSVESDRPKPSGDYAQSALGRERVFQYFSSTMGTPVCILRLNYAIDLRYGVLRDIADKVGKEEPVDLGSSHFNCIWQGDVLAQTLRSFDLCSSPATILNMTGPETVSVRWAAEEFGKRFGKTVRFSGREAERMYLNNASLAASVFGYPRMTLSAMIDLTAEWMKQGGGSLNKPTHFETTSGEY